ncbi:TPA: multidrug MFS transporter [Streptococcus suis]|nr:multidrug MFS transporter [Streptococcus suis]HEL1908878.1 multidrug MFS transporter [Streptococcus suis]
MIFVTVGTHEQPFDRLLKAVDYLVEKGVITEEVFIQTGYSTYIPKNCKWSKLLSFDKMNELMEKADIIITHGGPATFMSAIAKGKKPIVVPRLEKYGEHVNDHQLDFSKQVRDRYKSIIVVEEVVDLENYVNQELKNNDNIFSNNKRFNTRLRIELDKLLNK